MHLLTQLARFSVVGGLNTAIDLGVLNVLTLFTGVTEGSGYALQKAISFAAAAAFSFTANKRWTFADTSRTGRGRKAAQFITVSLLGAALNVSTATVVVTHVRPLVDDLLHAPLAAQLWVNLGALCGTGAGFVWNFLGYRQVVFRNPAGPSGPSPV